MHAHLDEKLLNRPKHNKAKGRCALHESQLHIHFQRTNALAVMWFPSVPRGSGYLPLTLCPSNGSSDRRSASLGQQEYSPSRREKSTSVNTTNTGYQHQLNINAGREYPTTHSTAYPDHGRPPITTTHYHINSSVCIV
jgi:hypothetical protein